MAEEKERGKRFNQGKTRHELVPPFAQEQYAKVLTFGANKYGDGNWKKGMPWKEVIASMKRHMNALETGQDFDPESGLLHSAQIMTNAAFLTEFYKIFPQGDDRDSWYKKNYKIGLDIDDVLSDFCTHFCNKFNIEIPAFWNFDRNIKEKFDSLDEEFWTNIPLKTKPEEIPFEPHCYITSRSIPKEWTEKWLDTNNFPAVPVYQVGVDGSKVEIALREKLDIFIDDRFTNFIELNNAGILTYLFTAKHNKRYDVGHKRINAVKDVLDRFQNI